MRPFLSHCRARRRVRLLIPSGCWSRPAIDRRPPLSRSLSFGAGADFPINP
jgi:hypothetical protein